MDKDDFTKYFHSLNSDLKKAKEKSIKTPREKSAELANNAKEIVNQYREKYADVDLDVLSNLITLKDVTSKPKSNEPNDAFRTINKHLGAKESVETLKQERWPKGIHCPFCDSKHIQKLRDHANRKQNLHKYICLDCEETFNDDTDTQIESGAPPLHTWMMCWYLLGTTTSIQFIASKLGLDLRTVEMMVHYMQKLFKANKPLTKFMTFDEWSIKYGKTQKALMHAELSKKRELLTGVNPNAPQDTAEYRRQTNRARDPHKKNPGTPKLRS